MTKLFQNKDVSCVVDVDHLPAFNPNLTTFSLSPQPTMRRVMYLTIKAMSTISEDVIMVTSSLMKDMTDKDDTFRAPAIRALCTITDVG